MNHVAQLSGPGLTAAVPLDKNLTLIPGVIHVLSVSMGSDTNIQSGTAEANVGGH